MISKHELSKHRHISFDFRDTSQNENISIFVKKFCTQTRSTKSDEAKQLYNFLKFPNTQINPNLGFKPQP